MAGKPGSRLYELFVRRGSAHGNDQQSWFEAERIVEQQAVRPRRA